MTRITLLLLLCLTLATFAGARKYDVGVSFASFRPVDSTAQEQFGENWDSFGIGIFEREAPTRWALSSDFRRYSNEERGSADLYIVSVGVARSLAPGAWLEPYISLRCGPYYGTVESRDFNIDDSGFGFNANATFGLLFGDLVFVEARYDYLTDISDFNLDGVRYGVGVRIGNLSM